VIDLHLVPLKGVAEFQILCREVLSVEELGRADRYRTEVAREEFVVSHAALRCLLAGYVGCLPTEVEYVLGKHGKPALAGAEERSVWQFNLSHSRGLAAIAVTRGGRIGIDVEGHRGLHRADSLAKTILSEQELAHYERLTEVQQEAFLLRTWTLKEAVLKAMGVGLSVDPREVELARVDTDSPQVVSLGSVEESENNWRLILPEVSKSHTLAIASGNLGEEQHHVLRVTKHEVRPWHTAVESSNLS